MQGAVLRSWEGRQDYPDEVGGAQIEPASRFDFTQKLAAFTVVEATP
jgi:hypothetical protein